MESRGFFERFLVCAAICMGFEDKINASSQVDVIIVGFKGIFVILLQSSWVLTSYLSICCNTDGFFKKSQTLFDIW